MKANQFIHKNRTPANSTAAMENTSSITPALILAIATAISLAPVTVKVLLGSFNGVRKLHSLLGKSPTAQHQKLADTLGNYLQQRGQR